MVAQPTAAPAAAAVPPTVAPTKTDLKVGLFLPTKLNLALYVAADRTFKEQGLNVELVTFDGGPGLAQALASDSVDVAALGATVVIQAIKAGHPVKAFYSGANLADYQWFAQPTIRNWADLRGKTLGVSVLGAAHEQFTRYILQKHGLQVGRDVNLVVVGGSATALQALKAGRVDAAIISTPPAWQAEAEGFTRLGTLVSEITDEWPQNMMASKERLLNEHPSTVQALLRGYVAAIRLAEADREAAIQAYVTHLKYERQDAERAYEEVRPALNERGLLPNKSMPIFWEIAMASGDVAEPWTEERFLDRRFIDSFDRWAPR